MAHKRSKKLPYEMRIRGEYFDLTPEGFIKRTDMEFEPSKSWKVFGVSKHWAKNNPDLNWKDLKQEMNKGKSVEGYLWDVDHNTVRMWGGRYAGKIPKVKMRRK